MITSVHVENYKCLRDVTVPLGPLTVLVGKNDTGKSSFIDALHHLSQLVAGGTPSILFGDSSVGSLAWKGAAPPTITWAVTVAPSGACKLKGPATYEIRIGEKGGGPIVEREVLSVMDDPSIGIRWVGQGANVREGGAGFGTSEGASVALGGVRAFAPPLPTLRSLSHRIGSGEKYQLDPRAVGRPSPVGLVEEPWLRHDGFGLPAVLDYILGVERSRFDRIESELRDAVPFVKALRLRPRPAKHEVVHSNSTGYVAREEREVPGKAVYFEITGGNEISAALASDGIMLFLAYLTMALAPTHPSLILLEEPENGVHPRQLQRIVDVLRKLSDPGKDPGAPQIVLTTHSPYLLDFVPAENVVVFGRRTTGESVAAPLAGLPGVEECMRSGLSVGEMWFNVGEDRLLEELLK